MSNNHTNNHPSGPEGGSAHNGSSSLTRREARLNNNTTGTLPALQAITAEQGTPQNPSDFEQMVHSLHDLFEHDRQIASQPDATRCGVCYLHFRVSDLEYRDEGFYVCTNCARSLGHQHVMMLRKQQKL